MADYGKIKDLQEKIKKNRIKIQLEEDYKKREILRLNIKIDELKIEIERLK
jgi:hypothetical protein